LIDLSAVSLWSCTDGGLMVILYSCWCSSANCADHWRHSCIVPDHPHRRCHHRCHRYLETTTAVTERRRSWHTPRNRRQRISVSSELV